MPPLSPTFDADGYPTDATLDAIAAWPSRDLAACLDFCRAAWHWPEFATDALSAHEAGVLRADTDGRYARFATGGWSGNEAIIAAMKANPLLYALTWRLTAVGGLHIFQYPKPDTREVDR